MPASVSDHGTSGEDCTNFKHVKTGFASSKIPTVVNLKMFFFGLNSPILLL